MFPFRPLGHFFVCVFVLFCFLNSFINNNKGFCKKNSRWHYMKWFQILIITFLFCE